MIGHASSLLLQHVKRNNGSSNFLVEVNEMLRHHAFETYLWILLWVVSAIALLVAVHNLTMQPIIAVLS